MSMFIQSQSSEGDQRHREKIRSSLDSSLAADSRRTRDFGLLLALIVCQPAPAGTGRTEGRKKLTAKRRRTPCLATGSALPDEGIFPREEKSLCGTYQQLAAAFLRRIEERTGFSLQLYDNVAVRETQQLRAQKKRLESKQNRSSPWSSLR